MREKPSDVDEMGTAKLYDETHDLSGFEDGEVESVEVRRNVTISVRLSEDEITILRARAEAADMKVTAYIRSAALQQAAPVDRLRVIGLLSEVSADVARVERLLKA